MRRIPEPSSDWFFSAPVMTGFYIAGTLAWFALLVADPSLPVHSPRGWLWYVVALLFSSFPGGIFGMVACVVTMQVSRGVAQLVNAFIDRRICP